MVSAYSSTTNFSCGTELGLFLDLVDHFIFDFCTHPTIKQFLGYNIFKKIIFMNIPVS
jgi:hypothetical protein